MRPLVFALLVTAALFAAGCFGGSTPPSTTSSSGPTTSQTVTVVTAKGTFSFALDPAVAPKTSAHIADLVQRGFYDGIPFHRFEPGFVLQGGDPKCKGDGWKQPATSGCGSGGSGQEVPGEFGGKHVTGAVGLARGPSPDSGDSQFYFVLDTATGRGLDGQYCVFGHVLGDGMAVVAQLRAGDVMTNVTLSTS